MGDVFSSASPYLTLKFGGAMAKPNDEVFGRYMFGDTKIVPGITMREYATIQAMTGILSRSTNLRPEETAKEAVLMADAMLKEMERPAEEAVGSLYGLIQGILGNTPHQGGVVPTRDEAIKMANALVEANTIIGTIGAGDDAVKWRRKYYLD